MKKKLKDRKTVKALSSVLKFTASIVKGATVDVGRSALSTIVGTGMGLSEGIKLNNKTRSKDNLTGDGNPNTVRKIAFYASIVTILAAIAHLSGWISTDQFEQTKEIINKAEEIIINK